MRLAGRIVLARRCSSRVLLVNIIIIIISIIWHFEMAKLFGTDKKMFNTLFKIAQEEGLYFEVMSSRVLAPGIEPCSVATQFYIDQYAVPIYGEHFIYATVD